MFSYYVLFVLQALILSEYSPTLRNGLPSKNEHDYMSLLLHFCWCRHCYCLFWCAWWWNYQSCCLNKLSVLKYCNRLVQMYKSPSMQLSKSWWRLMWGFGKFCEQDSVIEFFFHCRCEKIWRIFYPPSTSKIIPLNSMLSVPCYCT